jgi:hypothetical protein
MSHPTRQENRMCTTVFNSLFSLASLATHRVPAVSLVSLPILICKSYAIVSQRFSGLPRDILGIVRTKLCGECTMAFPRIENESINHALSSFCTCCKPRTAQFCSIITFQSSEGEREKERRQNELSESINASVSGDLAGSERSER